MENSNATTEKLIVLKGTKALQFEKAEIIQYLKDVKNYSAPRVVGSTTTPGVVDSTTKKALEKIWSEGFERYFNASAADPFLRADGHLSPKAITGIEIMGVKITIHTVYCALAAVFSLVPPTIEGVGPKTSSYAKYLLVLFGKWSLAIAPHSTKAGEENNVFHSTAPETFGLICCPPKGAFIFGTTKIGAGQGDRDIIGRNRKETLRVALGIKDWANIERFRDCKKEEYKKRKDEKEDFDMYWAKQFWNDKTEQDYGDCAESWGIQVMARWLGKGMKAHSFAISRTNLEQCTWGLDISKPEGWANKYMEQYKPACENCVRLFLEIYRKGDASILDAQLKWYQEK